MYLAYHEETKDAAQQRIWTFYEAVNISLANLAIFVNSFFVTDHRGLKIFPGNPITVSGCRVPQMQGIGLRSVQAVREPADNTVTPRRDAL